MDDSLFANMQHGAPLAHEIYFRAHIQASGAPLMATAEQMETLEDQPAYFRVRRKNRPLKPLPPVQLQTYVVDFTMMAQPKSGAANTRPPVLEVASAAFNADGQMLNGIVENTFKGFTTGKYEWDLSRPTTDRSTGQCDISSGCNTGYNDRSHWGYGGQVAVIR